MEPNTFRHEFAARLRDLQVNSRPIIQNLSMLAHDYTRYAHIVAQCLESHIREVSRLSLFSCVLALPVSVRRAIL